MTCWADSKVKGKMAIAAGICMLKLEQEVLTNVWECDWCASPSQFKDMVLSLESAVWHLMGHLASFFKICN